VYTQTTTGDGSLTLFSHRSNSTATAATTISMSDDETFVGKSPRSRKLLKRGRYKNPSESYASPSRGSRGPLSSRSANNTDIEYSDSDDDDGTALEPPSFDDSEWDLARRLELARRNSQNQHNKPVPPLPLEKSVEETIYEGM
jgi:hypothetical protein